MGKLLFLVWIYPNELAFTGLWNYLILSCIDKVMDTLLKTAQNTLKLGAVFKSGLCEKNWCWFAHWKFVISGVWIDQGVIFHMLLNRLNPSSVEKVMVVLLWLRELKLYISVFYPDFRDLTMWIMLCVLNKSFSGHYELFILGF